MSGDDDFGPVERGSGRDDWGSAPVERSRRGGARPDDAGIRRPPSGPDRGSSGRGSSNRGAVAAPDRQDDGFGPPSRGRSSPVGRRRGGRGGRRVLRTLALVLLVLVLLVVATGTALALFTTSQIDREEVTGLQSAPGGRMNVLIVGSDSRDGLSEEELGALGTEAVDGRRTDTIFVMSIEGGRAAMLSFPRDLYVTRCDGTQGRINAAYNNGGPSCLVDTVTRVSGIPITHYLEVNFVGFLRLVDAVGGVSLYLEEPLVDAYAGLDLPAGCNHLDGATSLGFVRARYVDNDLGRIARQQRFIRELAAEVSEPSTLLNLVRLFAVAGAGAGSLVADEGLGIVDLAKFARAARGLAGAGLATFTVPATPDSIGGAAVLVPNEGEAEAVFSTFRDGSVLNPPESPEPSTLTPDQVTVAVLNGAGVGGLAAQGEGYLVERGFQVSDVGNADAVDTTVVRYPEGQSDAAALVASQVPGATTEQADVDEVTLVLGADADLSDAPAAPEPAAPEEDAADDAPATEEAPPLGAGPVPTDC